MKGSFPSGLFQRAAISGLLLFTALGSALAQEGETPPPNFLLILGDDMGVETLASYQLNDSVALTPNLDRLAAEGIRFNNMWSQPVCSPTRATVMTGRYGFRNKVGHAVISPTQETVERAVPVKPDGAPREDDRQTPYSPFSPPGLSLNEFTLPMALKSDSAMGYEAGAFGKWHLSDESNGYEKHPILAGFDYFAGTAIGGIESFFAYSKQVNGELTSGSTVYAATDKVNEAIRWISERDSDRPWLTYLAFNLPHSPFHLPPLDLLHDENTRGLDPQSNAVNTAPHPYFRGMMEAMDTEIGRLLDSLPDEVRANTYVIFLGDNGSTREAVTAPFDSARAKGTIYQGGVNVPFIITGPGIEGGRVSDAILNSVDIYATLLDLASISLDTALPRDVNFDSVSFAPLLHDPEAQPLRDFAYADLFAPERTTLRTIRTESYKLLVIGDVEELYNLDEDPYEHNNLLLADLSDNAQENYENLKLRMQLLLASESGQEP
jgi:arylsulfatase B